MNALLNLEVSDRFGGVRRFVNIGRHQGNLLVNGLSASLFVPNSSSLNYQPSTLNLLKQLGNRRFHCRLASSGRSAIGHFPRTRDIHGINTHIIAKQRALLRPPWNGAAPFCAFSALRCGGPNSATRHSAKNFCRRARLATIPSRQRPVITSNFLSLIISDPNGKSALLQRRRRKVIGFIIAEVSAIGVLLLTGALALSLRQADPSLALSVNILTIVAAVAVAATPIIFFAIAPILPHGD